MGELSYEMLTRLLQEKKGVETKATLRIKTLLFWLKVNSQKLSEESKDKTLKTMYFVLEHFTHRELASSDVRMSDLYDIDKIIQDTLNHSLIYLLVGEVYDINKLIQ